MPEGEIFLAPKKAGKTYRLVNLKTLSKVIELKGQFSIKVKVSNQGGSS